MSKAYTIIFWRGSSLWDSQTGTIREFTCSSPWPLMKQDAESTFAGSLESSLGLMLALPFLCSLLKSPWNGVGCNLPQTSQAFLFVHTFDKRPGSRQPKHNPFVAAYSSLAGMSFFRNSSHLSKSWRLLQSRQVFPAILFPLWLSIGRRGLFPLAVKKPVPNGLLRFHNLGLLRFSSSLRFLLSVGNCGHIVDWLFD